MSSTLRSLEEYTALHLIVQNEKVDVFHPSSEVKVNPQFHWKNSYQAPDLFQQSLPPEFSPLMVG